MTSPGARRHDATGRSSGRLKPHRASAIEGPWVPCTREMLESPAWRALSLADRITLDRLCIEHMSHAGTENGRLKCTYGDFEAFGIRRKSIAHALRRLEALGFIETMQRGKISRGEFRVPALYRITFVSGNAAPTHEWRRLDTQEAVARKLARCAKEGAKSPPLPGAKTPLVARFPGGENATPVPGAETPPLSISREGAGYASGADLAMTADSKGRHAKVQALARDALQASNLIVLPNPLRKGGADSRVAEALGGWAAVADIDPDRFDALTAEAERHDWSAERIRLEAHSRAAKTNSEGRAA